MAKKRPRRPYEEVADLIGCVEGGDPGRSSRGPRAVAAASRQRRLSPSMTEVQFENGYWYAGELKEFAARLGVPAASRLRKDELERAIRYYLRHRRMAAPPKRSLTKTGTPDVERGLRLDLSVVHYTSNRETKDFIEREAAKLEPGFRRKAGSRYLLNRWRERQLAVGRRLTYRDLVEQAIVLNRTKRGPLRLEHGRYMNFVSDFAAHRPGASRDEVARAWKEVKAMDAPKTYAAWAKAARSGRKRRRR